MKLSKKCIFSVLAAASLVSCSDDAPFKSDGGEGVLRLALKTNADVMVSPAKTRAGSETITAPDAESFAVRLTKSDNSYSQTWESLSRFNAEESFLSGTYSLEAFYGDIQEEGFEKPYFYGSAQATVLEEKTTNVSLTATLANSMISIVYTDSFKEYFSSYSARVHSTGHDYIEFASDETRPAYVAPGNVDLFVNIERNGKQTTLQPSSFQAQARHHYTVRYDIKGGVGDAQLTITFEDELIGESVQIDLTDELFTTPAPTITPSGFTSGQSFEFIESAGLESPVRFNVMARGGLKEANLTVVSDSYTPAFGSEINLCGASASLQNQLNAAGVKAIGFYKNPEECRMGYVDIMEFSKLLPAGTHTVTLLVKDKFTRCSEPISVTLTSVPVEISATGTAVVYGASEATVTVAYNGSHPEKISFKALDNYGVYQNCEIKTIAPVNTRALPSKNYTFTIAVPACDRDKLPIQVYFDNTLKYSFEIPVVIPEYDVEADAYATKVMLKVKTDDPAMTSLVAENMKVFVVGPSAAKKRVKGTRRFAPTISRDAQNGIVTVNGLAPATAYTLNTALVPGENPTIIASAKVTTETALAVPNGDFESLGSSPAIALSNINQGGEWTITRGGTRYRIHCSISLFEPAGWATVNKKTCPDEASNKNTWFLNPSAYASNISWTVHHPTAKALFGQNAYDAVPAEYTGIQPHNGSIAMVVRNVGYNLAGTDPSYKNQTGNTSFSNYFNPDAPAEGSKAVGKLFLGSYSFSGGSENYSEGVGFASRPSALKGFYKYKGNADGENAVVKVSLLNGSTVIGTGTVSLGASAEYGEFTVPVTYSHTFMKATSLRVMILSSDRDDSSVPVAAHAANKDEASFYGATLVVDNLSFVY